MTTRRKRSKKSLIRELDSLFATAVRKRGRCQFEGLRDYEYGKEIKHKRDTLQCAHIITRGNFATRWNKDNALCLCASCHFWAHDNPVEFGKLAEKVIGRDTYAEVRREANEICKRTSENYQEMIDSYDHKKIV